MVCLDVGYFVCDGGVVGVFACVEVALVSSTRSGKRGRRRDRGVWEADLGVGFVFVCACAGSKRMESIIWREDTSLRR